jgi:hypothetical protein
MLYGFFYIPEDNILYSHCRDELSSYIGKSEPQEEWYNICNILRHTFEDLTSFPVGRNVAFDCQIHHLTRENTHTSESNNNFIFVAR